MKSISVILKATESCNLRCKYCYNCDSKYAANVMSEERLTRLFTMLAQSYRSVSIVWHGGEPLMAGLDYMRKAMRLQHDLTKRTGCGFDNSIQTNGTLVDKEWIAFFKRYDIKVGVSFDGLANEQYRQMTDKVLASIRLMQKKGLHIGCLAVVADDENDLIENYKFFAAHQLHYSLSPMFSEGGGAKLPPLQVENFTRQVNALFDYWLLDKKGVNIRLFSDYITMFLGGHMRTCTNGSCHGKWLGVDPEGNLYNCGRDAMKEYCFGNIDDMEDITDAFYSDGFRRLLLGTIERRNQCMATCEFFPYCQSGCSDCALTENGLTNAHGFSCECFRSIFAHVCRKMKEVVDGKVPLSTLNPSVRLTAMQCLGERD